MVKQHILIGLGLKKQNFRNRAIHYMLNRAGKAMGGALPQNQMTIIQSTSSKVWRCCCSSSS